MRAAGRLPCAYAIGGKTLLGYFMLSLVLIGGCLLGLQSLLSTLVLPLLICLGMYCCYDNVSRFWPKQLRSSFWSLGLVVAAVMLVCGVIYGYLQVLHRSFSECFLALAAR